MAILSTTEQRLAAAQLRIEILQAENAALKADAERYRWLRDKAYGHPLHSLTEDVDAAMKEQQP